MFLPQGNKKSTIANSWSAQSNKVMSGPPSVLFWRSYPSTSSNTLNSPTISLHHTSHHTSNTVHSTPETPSHNASSDTPSVPNQYKHVQHARPTPPLCHTLYTLYLHPASQLWPKKKLISKACFWAAKKYSSTLFPKYLALRNRKQAIIWNNFFLKFCTFFPHSLCNMTSSTYRGTRGTIRTSLTPITR